MTDFIARRFITKNGPMPYPASPDTYGEVQVVDAPNEFSDVLDNGANPLSSFDVWYEAVLYTYGLHVLVDRFYPDPFPHTWAGWPQPGVYP